MGRHSLVGIATRYGLDDPGTNSGPIRGPSQPYINGYRVSFPEVKRPGRGLYPYSPLGLPWPVLWRTLPLPLSHSHAFSCLFGQDSTSTGLLYDTIQKCLKKSWAMEQSREPHGCNTRVKYLFTDSASIL